MRVYGVRRGLRIALKGNRGLDHEKPRERDWILS